LSRIDDALGARAGIDASSSPAAPMDEDSGTVGGEVAAAAAVVGGAGVKRRGGHACGDGACGGGGGGGGGGKKKTKKEKFRDEFAAAKRPGERPHVPMRLRPTECTYEERTSKLEAKKAKKEFAAAHAHMHKADSESADAGSA
jgi:hypothetical protein